MNLFKGLTIVKYAAMSPEYKYCKLSFFTVKFICKNRC
jgi:hypothetical protein